MERASWLTKEILANYRHSRKKVSFRFRGKNAARDGRRAEVARYLQLLVLHDGFAHDVARLRRKHRNQWSRILPGPALRGRVPKTDLDRELSSVLARYVLDNLLVHRLRFLPMIGRPYPARPMLGEGLGGRYGGRTAMLRMNKFDQHLAMYVRWELEQDCSGDVACREFGVSTRTMENCVLVMTALFRSIDEECERRGEHARLRRRALAPEQWAEWKANDLR